MRMLVGFILGLVFSAGLMLAQMTNPAKVLAFLDIRGGWDPSLALVMASGLTVFALGFWLLKPQMKSGQETLLGSKIQLPKGGKIDKALIGGAILFGAGWGLIGLCPGPALAALTVGGWPIALFVAAMLIGMGGFSIYTRLRG